LLAEAKVAVVPGIAFGDGDYFRISYATSENELIRAASQIVEALNKLV
jgi:aspartate aminotransferase